jgi:transcription termination factor Rho
MAKSTRLPNGRSTDTRESALPTSTSSVTDRIDDVDAVDGDEEYFAAADARYEEAKRSQIHIAGLQRMTMKELLDFARDEGISEYTGLKKQDLIFRILKERTKMNGLMFGEGTLEILPDGFGFLRSPDYHYLPCPSGFARERPLPGRFVRLRRPSVTLLC